MKVRVLIERVVLDGFQLSAADVRRVKAELQRELSRLLASPGGTNGWQTGGAVATLTGGEFDPPHDVTPPQLGERIAQSVHVGIGTRR
jgi:hypothetical protein